MKIDKNKLDIARAGKCVRLSELADETGLSIATIYNIRNGHAASPVSVGKIAAALGVPVTDIIIQED